MRRCTTKLITSACKELFINTFLRLSMSTCAYTCVVVRTNLNLCEMRERPERARRSTKTHFISGPVVTIYKATTFTRGTAINTENNSFLATSLITQP